MEEKVIDNMSIEDASVEENSELKIKLEKFEGPLDLLLHLIKEAKVDIKDIFIAEITEQFIEYVKNEESFPAETIGDFISMASTLLQIKSRKLLPVKEVEVEDEEDPEVKLIRQLEEYKLFKEKSEELKALEDTGKLYKAPEKLASSIKYELKDISFDALLEAYAKILERVQVKTAPIVPREIQKDRFTVAQKIAEIKDRLLSSTRLEFSELYETDYSKSEVINTFLALLELLKVQEVKVVQMNTYGEIYIEKQQ